MSTETKDILLKLKLEGDQDLRKRNNELLVSIQKNKDAIAENTKALNEFKKAGDTSSKTVNDLKIQNIEMTKANQSMGKELLNNIKIIGTELGALDEKRAKLSNMNAAYAKLSDEEKKNSASAQAQAAAIKKLSDELKEEEKALGNTSRNVGNYTEDIIKANEQLGIGNTTVGKAVTGFKAFKVAAMEASGGTSLLNGALKLLQSNPIFAILAVIVGVFLALKEAINRNKQIVDEFTAVLLPLKAIIGTVFSIVSGFVEILVGGLSKGLEAVASLFGSAGDSAKYYSNAIREADAAQEKMTNLLIRQRAEQEELNRLSAISNNRMIEGKSRREAINKVIETETGLVKEAASLQTSILKGSIAELEAKYNLKGKLVNSDYTLTVEALNKLGDDERKSYEESASAYYDSQAKKTEILAATARKRGQIEKSIVADEKAERDLGIAAMNDGLGKTIATIKSNYKAQSDEMRVSFKEQRELINLKYQDDVLAAENNAAKILVIFAQHEKDLSDLRMKEAKQQGLIDAAEAQERQKAARDEAKQRKDSKLNLLRQQQDSELAATAAYIQATLALEKNLTDLSIAQSNEAFIKESQQRQVEFSRKREDLKNELQYSGKNKKETNELIKALDKQEKAEQLAAEKAHQKAINDIVTGAELDRKTKEIELRLAAVKVGSGEELSLRLEQLKIQEEAELLEAEKTGANKNLITAKYAKEAADLNREARAKLTEEIKQEYLNQIEEERQAGADVFSMRIEQKQQEIAALQQLDGESSAAFKARRLALKNDIIQIEQEQADAEIQIAQAKIQTAQALTDGLSAINDAFTTSEEKNASWARRIALFQIGLDTALALTAAIANAQRAAAAGGPLAPVLSVLYTAQAFATVLGAVAKAKKLLTEAPKAQGKALGGLVRGPGSGTSDSIPTNLSNLESVNNSRSTAMFSPLYSGLNMAGGGVPIQSVSKSAEVAGEEFLANSFLRAIVRMPAPVLDVQEFHRVDSRLTTIIENSKG